MENFIRQDIEVHIEQESFPLLIHFRETMSPKKFTEWFQQNKHALEENLLKTGAILFRGIDIHDMNTFEGIMDQLTQKFMPYIDGNSPRTKLSSKVYTSTEYDANHFITLHNELSYSAKWPARLFFCCLIPAATGGETPIADSRKILAAMPAGLVDKIEKNGIIYIRNLNGGQGIGPSWQDTFETQDKAQVEAFCRESSIRFEWKPDGGIKLIQPSKGIIQHPQTGEKVWFNQIDQFHPNHLDPEIYETLMMMYQEEEELPMFVKFGDGTPITVDMVKEIRQVVDGQAHAAPWQKGDLLMVDNVLVCHGRKPYAGDRKVLVSMSA